MKGLIFSLRNLDPHVAMRKGNTRRFLPSCLVWVHQLKVKLAQQLLIQR